ncbi:MAG: DUF6427 family protein [Bacteroidales bacterium]|nr:DUF6427 family protein [Bacteroidales bacterium]
MNSRGSRYSFFTAPATLLILLLAFWISAGFVPNITIEEDWVPALISFTDISQLGHRWSIYFGTFFLLLNSFSLYVIGLKSLYTGRNKFLIPLIYLLFVLVSPSSLYFSGTSVASLLLLWSLYFSITSKQSNLHFFISGFLASNAILFEPSLTLLVFLIMAFAFSSRGLSARSLVMMLSSILIPFLFTLSIRYLLFEDATLFAELFYEKITSVSPFQIGLQSFADLVLYIALFVVLLSAVWHIAEQRGRYKIEKSRTMTRFVLMLIVLLLIIVLFPNKMTAYAPIIAIPAAVLMNEYLLNYDKSNKHKIQWIILLTLMLVARISEIIL